MTMFSWFTKKPCLICVEKDMMIHQLKSDASRDRLRLSITEEKLSKATDLLLAQSGKAGIAPPQRFSAKDADDLMRDSFAMFLDEEDKGDGKIRDVDNLDFDKR